MEETISGFRVEGDWEEIVEHGERISRALREAGVLARGLPDDVDAPQAFEEWDDWRPKAHEGLDSDMNEKTATQASVDEADRSPDQADAGDLPPEEGMVREADDVNGDEKPTPVVGALARGLGAVAEAAGDASRQALQRAEEAVYKNVMTQIGPYYFDNGLVSANIRRTEEDADGGGERFLLEVNVNDDDLKEDVSDRLEAYAEAREDDLTPDVSSQEDPAAADPEDLDLEAGTDGDGDGDA